MKRRALRILLAGGSCALALSTFVSSAYAQTRDDESLRDLVDRQAAMLKKQQEILDQQQAELAEQRLLIDEIRRSKSSVDLALNGRGRDGALEPFKLASSQSDGLRGAGVADDQRTTLEPAVPGPVGEAPPPEAPTAELAALPEGVGVLTPRGRLVLDPSIDATLSSSNRLVFRGVEIVTGVQIGVIEASDADRSSLGTTLAMRYGLTDRLEVEARVPYVWRKDEITTLAQGNQTTTRSFDLEGRDFGDIEVAARYQLTSGQNGDPVLVGNLRYKSDTGTGPFDVDRDEFGVATSLPTGSGFWGLEPSLTLLIPSDPTVIFANVGYLYHAPKDIDRLVNGVQIGEVDPGDSINIGLGFGFSVNPRFSYSLGYRHSYIFATESELGGTRQQSDDLHSGALQFGWSYRLTDAITLNNNFEFGVTQDAPDVRIVLRTPFMF